MDWRNKLKNMWLWAGILGSALLAAGVDFNTLTDWGLLAQAFLSIVQNPVALVSFLAAIVAILINPNTKGWRD